MDIAFCQMLIPSFYSVIIFSIFFFFLLILNRLTQFCWYLAGAGRRQAGWGGWQKGGSKGNVKGYGGHVPTSHKVTTIYIHCARLTNYSE